MSQPASTPVDAVIDGVPRAPDPLLSISTTRAPLKGPELPLMATPSLAHLDDEVFTHSHKKMDEAVLKQIALCFGTGPQCPPHDVLLSTIIEKCPELYQDPLDEAYLGRINKLLVEYTQLGSMLEDCWEKQSFESIRDLGASIPVFSPTIEGD